MYNKLCLNIKKDRAFYKYLFILTLPIVLQNLIATSLNMLDTLMIGKVGEIELASVGIANQFYFLFSLFAMGIGSGCGVLIAQLWGKKDIDNIHKILAKSLIITIITTMLFFVLGFFLPEQVIGLFTKDSQVIAVGASYLKITIFSYLFTGITFTVASAFRSIGNSHTPMFASLIGLIINAFLNYCLIFGKLGFPQLNTDGAAIATLIARIVECLIIITYVYLKVPTLKLHLKDALALPKNLKDTLFKVTAPIVFNEACWGLGTVTYIAIYAHISTKASAAMQICSTIMNLFSIISFGLAYASLVIIGNEIGANNNEGAYEKSKKIISISVIASILLGLILILLAAPIVSFFNVSNEVKMASKYVLYIFGAILSIKSSNMIIIVGVLRGGGDAAFGSILQIITLWGIGIPLAFFAAFVLHLPVYSVVAFTIVEEITKLMFLIYRYKSMKWLKNIVN